MPPHRRSLSSWRGRRPLTIASMRKHPRGGFAAGDRVATKGCPSTPPCVKHRVWDADRSLRRHQGDSGPVRVRPAIGEKPASRSVGRTSAFTCSPTPERTRGSLRGRSSAWYRPMVAGDAGASGATGVVRAGVLPPGGHLRRVNLIERQRDQRESEAVSRARAPQRPVPALSSLPPLATHSTAGVAASKPLVLSDPSFGAATAPRCSA